MIDLQNESILKKIKKCEVRLQKISRNFNANAKNRSLLKEILNVILKFQILIIFFSVLYLALFLQALVTIGFTSVSQFLLFFTLLPLSNAYTLAILLGLVLISVYLFYQSLGYDLNQKLHGTTSAMFIFLGFVFLLSGLVVMTNVPMNTSEELNLNSNFTTQVNIYNDYLLTYSNVSHSSSFNFTTSYDDKSQDKSSSNISASAIEAIKKLSSGIFGNALGMIGISLALIAFGISNYDKIQTFRTEEEILYRLQKKEECLKKYRISLSYKQIFSLGLIWIFCSIFIGLILGLFPKMLPEQFYTWVNAGVIIEVVGLLIMTYGYYELKKLKTKNRRNRLNKPRQS
jgi:hypothetical protein